MDDVSGCEQAVTCAQLEAAAATFALLSTPSRLHLVWLLASSESDVSTLAEKTGANVPAVSQHLAKLKAGGIVSSRRDGRRQLYSVDDPHVLTMVGQMFDHISPDGTLAPDGVPANADGQRRPRFD
jgi:DNA-binding transcriptional ArsR family regulator